MGFLSTVGKFGKSLLKSSLNTIPSYMVFKQELNFAKNFYNAFTGKTTEKSKEQLEQEEVEDKIVDFLDRGFVHYRDFESKYNIGYKIRNKIYGQYKEGCELFWPYFNDKTEKFGKMVYDCKVPGVSDYIGALTGTNDPIIIHKDTWMQDIQKITFSSVYGSIQRGVCIGAKETIGGLQQLILNPEAVAQGGLEMIVKGDRTIAGLGELAGKEIKENGNNVNWWGEKVGDIGLQVALILSGGETGELGKVGQTSEDVELIDSIARTNAALEKETSKIIDLVEVDGKWVESSEAVSKLLPEAAPKLLPVSAPPKLLPESIVGEQGVFIKQGIGIIEEEKIAEEAHNVVNYAKYKELLKTTEAANPLVESLKTTGGLPQEYVTKSEAMAKGWKPGKALENCIPGGQIGGDEFLNKTGILPQSAGRTWYEADVGLSGTMSRAKQPGTRLVYSNDGLMYVTYDHYKTVHSIGTWK